MTTLVDGINKFYDECGVKPCTQRYIPPGRTAAEIYNGTARPDMWLIVLGINNFSVAATVAVAALQSFAGDLPTGTQQDDEFKADLLSLTSTSTDWKARRRRVLKRSNARPSTNLENGYTAALEFLKTKDARHLQGVGAAVAEFDKIVNTKDLATARADLYTYLRSQVTEVAFKTGIDHADGGGDEVYT